MKSRLLFVALLAVAVMMTASTAFAAPTSKATPLKGSWDSSEIPTFVPAPPPDAVTMYVDGDASGNATHLGKYRHAGYNLVTQFYAITGGTGRFAGATGNFTVTRLVNNATGVSKGSFDGTIVLAPDK